MNTRLQVEHPITEMITGVDLVRAQLTVAAGDPLPFGQADLRISGHAVECRIYAEDPRANFRPAPGPLHVYREPSGPFVRVDSGVVEGMAVPIHYDPMVAKLVVWGKDRAEALARAGRALRDYRIVGIPTSIPFFLALFEDEGFAAGHYDTGFITPEFMDATVNADDPETAEVAAIAAAIVKVEAERHKQPQRATTSAGAWKRPYTWTTMNRGR